MKATNKFGFSSQELREAAARIQKLDASEITEEYLRYEMDCPAGTFVAVRLNPKSGEIYHSNEASRCCSTDEYFGESGSMSRVTLKSGTRAHWSPGPEEGFEWDYCGRDEANYFHPKDKPERWESINRYDDDTMDEADFEFFTVSSRPVCGSLDPDRMVEKEIQEQLDAVADKLNEEADDLESSESES